MAARRAGDRRRRWLTAAGSAAAHLAILGAVLSAHRDTPALIEPPAIEVALVAPLPPPEAPAVTPPAPAPPAPVRPPPPRNLARPPKTPVQAVPLPASKAPVVDGSLVSDSQLASAATAGSGSGAARPCDMLRRLQAALRRDGRVQAAVAEAGAGRAMRVWDGDWIRSGSQDGAGLAAVREAIQWEVGFAPEACRAEPVHGLVAISLDDSPGAPRLVVGAGAWRWSDLLHPRRGG